MEWSPPDAMKAFLKTSDLCKIHRQGSTRPPLEPECMEFVSALAAGRQAKLIVEITTQGVTPLTLALAVAATQTRGHLICIVPHDKTKNTISNHLKQHMDLEKVARIVIGDPCEVIKQYKNIDFAVIDGKYEDHLRLFEIIDMKQKGSVVVVNSKVCRKSFGEVVKGKRGSVESVVSFPFGEGMELTRMGSSNSCGGRSCRSGKSRRFYVVDE
ncbi:hypothetical protein DCAR_0311400 [Daucus carota subsp. sativus]|uniref:S-adenosyl-L-methionine-dependent methyltransferase n=2 Tax=Daucus carota subsp. sativus TaxID=79200 RepID=A0AAF0WQ81_DAUCS|nr:hypothetical protein DCAR_0311400 [Daucus carota subsp. sativus]